MEHALDALGNETRRTILKLLADQPRSVGEIAEALPISRPAVSRHLRLLEEAELVETRSDGRRNVVSVRHDGFEAARQWLDSFWDDALGRFKLVAENTTDSDEAGR